MSRLRQETTQAQTSRFKYRGQAVIIVNEQFHVAGASELTRHGATSDLKKMTAVFNALGFKVLAFKDLKAAEMLEKIKTACDDVHNEHSEYFSLVISSHGEEDFHETSDEDRKWLVLGSDCKPVKINELIMIIRKSTRLKNKPKLIFIQACRSRKNSDTVFDRGVSVDVEVPCTCHGQPSEAVDVTDEALMKLVRKLQIDTTTCDIYQDWPDVPGQWMDDDLADNSGAIPRRSESECVASGSYLATGTQSAVQGQIRTRSSSSLQVTPSCAPLSPPTKKVRRTTSMEMSEKLTSECNITSSSNKSPRDSSPAVNMSTRTTRARRNSRTKMETDTMQVDTQGIEPRLRELPTPQVAPRGLHGELPGPTVTAPGPLVAQPEPQPLASITQSTGYQLRPRGRGTQLVQQGPQVVGAEQETLHRAQQDPEPGSPQASGSDSCVEQIYVPDDFLVVCPAMSGKVAYRQSDSGSRLFHSMYRKEHIKVLLEGGDILRYLTLVAKDIAAQENIIDNESFKANICVQHRLCQKVRFAPIKENTLMDRVKREFV